MILPSRERWRCTPETASASASRARCCGFSAAARRRRTTRPHDGEGWNPMNPRNRIPTVFGIYMLDVICCALGCVILLWQLSHQEAEQQTAAAAQERENYERASR